MRKIVIMLLIVALFSQGLVYAKGGLGPCLASCFLGPRIGLEMNEGSKIRNAEWLALVASLVAGMGWAVNMWDPMNGKSMNQIRRTENLGGVAVTARAPKQKGGLGAGLAGCCFGPRVGLELNDGRKIRTMEWIGLVIPGVPQLLIGFEAMQGKTMSQIAAAEGLDR